MTNQQNQAVVKKFFEEIYSKGNVNVLDELLAPNFKLMDPAATNVKGLPAYKELEQQYSKAFPNKTAKIEEILPSEDKVIVRWTVNGTHKGELQGLPPTNQNIKITGISIFHVVNGKISEIHQQWDRLGLLEQLGEIEPAVALHR